MRPALCGGGTAPRWRQATESSHRAHRRETAVSDNHTQERDDPGHETAAGFRLRPERPTVMRLSRKVLAGLAAVASIAILGSLIWALDTRKRSQQSGQELFN